MSPSLFPDFDRLSPILYLHTSSQANINPTPASTGPELIILATWMNAPPKLINLYAKSYRQHFPDSRILLITSSMSDIFFTPKATYNAQLRPALPLLDKHRGKLVAAVYSNGGAIALASLASLYATTKSSPLPLHGLLLDSAPGSGKDLGSGRRAISASLPPALRRGLLRYLVLSLLTGALWFWGLFFRWLRRVDPITSMRKALNDGKVVERGGKRTYIFSKEDEMVGFEAVLSHADESEAHGWIARTELWTGSGHVAHARADPGRYWSIIRETLEERR